MTTSQEYALLSQRLTPQRKEKLERVVGERTKHIVLGIENVNNPQNAAALLRTADAFGIQGVEIFESEVNYQVHPKITRGTHHWLTVTTSNVQPARGGVRPALEGLRKQGYRIVATSVVPGSLPLSQLDLSFPFVLFFGNEHNGLSPELLQEADEHVHLPMQGFTESLNVSVCCGIALHYLVSKLKATDLPWQLSADQQMDLLAQWAKKSVPKAEIYLRELEKLNQK